MSLLPDPSELRAVARSITSHATAARTRAARLTRAATCTGWRGTAAGAFALKADDTAHALRLAADRLDDAAAALHRHAHAVEGALSLARVVAVGAERGLESAAADGASVLGDAASVLGHAGSALSGAAGLVGL